MFPNRDYCVITIPQMVPEFPLLQSFIVYFIFQIFTIFIELFLAYSTAC
jgi:hypothetical protein